MQNRTEDRCLRLLRDQENARAAVFARFWRQPGSSVAPSPASQVGLLWCVRLVEPAKPGDEPLRGFAVGLEEPGPDR